MDPRETRSDRVTKRPLRFIVIFSATALGFMVACLFFHEARSMATLAQLRVEWNDYLSNAQRRNEPKDDIVRYAKSIGADVAPGRDDRGNLLNNTLYVIDRRIVRFAPWSWTQTVVSIEFDSSGRITSFDIGQRTTSL